MEKRLTVALIQYRIHEARDANLDTVEDLLRRARQAGADLAVMPELFNQPYDMRLVPERAEGIPDGPSCRRLSALARGLGVVLVGGSMAERTPDGRIYNTATIWSADGDLLARHRKMHLFDVDFPGVTVRESAVFAAGDGPTLVDILGMRLGVAICYDVRFPELFRWMALSGADFVALPGAFNNVSGPAHWEMLLRNRAAENTYYVAGVSGLSGPDDGYQAWGHSMLADPFAEVLVDMGRAEGFGLAVLDPERIREVRARLPVLSQRRKDLYRLTPAEPA